MVAKNPLLAGGGPRWSFVKKFNATVINDIWPETFFFTLVATMVSLVSEKTSHSLAISNQMLTVLGTVLGLVVSFRTSSAYDRYWEGRRLWTAINLTSRNLAHLIWIHVPIDREDKTAAPLENGSKPKVPPLKAVIEKKSMVTLVQAFSVAVKHALRGEPGIYYKDLYPLVSFLPRYASEHVPGVEHSCELLPLWGSSHNGTHSPDGTSTPLPPSHVHPTRTMSFPGAHMTSTNNDFDEKLGSRSSSPGVMQFRNKKRKTFDPESVLPDVPSQIPLLPARNPPHPQLYDYLPVLLIFKPIISLFKHMAYKLHLKSNPLAEGKRDDRDRDGLGRKVKPAIAESNVPLEITLFLSSYLQWLLKNGLLQPAIATAFTNALISLQDTMANLDRVRTTPIPFAYQAHLRMSMWLYLFFLPFQIYNAFGYLTIPATAFGSFLLLGFLEIGQEIENPFNYDLNDLDLDDFCLTIQRELAEVTAHPVTEPHTYVFGPWNQPFAPTDRRSASEILKEGMMHHHQHNPLDRDATLNNDRDLAHGAHANEFGVFGPTGGGVGGMMSVRETLLKNWREVSDQTVEHKPKYKTPKIPTAQAAVTPPPEG